MSQYSLLPRLGCVWLVLHFVLTGLSCAQTNDGASMTPLMLSNAALAARVELAAAQATTTLLESRVRQLEDDLTQQRQQNVTALQSAYRFTLAAFTALAVVAVLGMAVLALIVFRIVHRRTESVALQPFAQSLTYATPVPPDPAANPLLSAGAVPAANARFLNAVERLEKRLGELEAAARAPGPEQLPSAPAPASAPAPRPTTAPGGMLASTQLALLLGKGQSLLKLNQPEAALACFDEALWLDPANGEALLKRGLALEKLSRLDEALESYNKALLVDETLTMAYLYKGGVCNRLERYGDALKCYEQALHSQKRPRNN